MALTLTVAGRWGQDGVPTAGWGLCGLHFPPAPREGVRALLIDLLMCRAKGEGWEQKGSGGGLKAVISQSSNMESSFIYHTCVSLLWPRGYTCHFTGQNYSHNPSDLREGLLTGAEEKTT